MIASAQTDRQGRHRRRPNHNGPSTLFYRHFNPGANVGAPLPAKGPIQPMVFIRLSFLSADDRPLITARCDRRPLKYSGKARFWPFPISPSAPRLRNLRANPALGRRRRPEFPKAKTPLRQSLEILQFPPYIHLNLCLHRKGRHHRMKMKNAIGVAGIVAAF